MNKPNVLFVVMDAVRYDHVSCYGYSKKTTPNIDEIADNNILFENAFSTAPWTPPSHASMFTGMYPSQHGVYGKNLYLNEKILNMAEVFTSKGYETLGISANYLLNSKTGFHRGFKKFIDHSPHHITPKFLFDWITFCLETDIRALVYRWGYNARIFQEIKKWIQNSRKKSKNFFIFVNYIDAHIPFNPLQPFKRKFKNIQHGVDLKKIKYFSDNYGFPYIGEEIELTFEEWNVIRSLYDGEIACIDFFLGKVFDYLKKIKLYDNTFIVITSDHGENFGDHQLANHCFCLYDTLIHVPLILSFPRYSSKRKKISSLVSLIDIFPTMMNILDVEMKKEIKGQNLIPFENRRYHTYICAECEPPLMHLKALKRVCPHFDSSIYDRSLKCIRTENYKYIIASDGKEELYDLAKDPSEIQNIAKKFPEKTRELKSIMSKELGKPSIKRKAGLINGQTKKRLQELGYL